LQDSLEQRRQLLCGLLAVAGRSVLVSRLDHRAVSVGVRAAVQGIDWCQNRVAALVHQIDTTEIPARVAHRDFGQVAKACRDLETHALERNRPIAEPLTPAGLNPEGRTQLITGRAVTHHMGGSRESLDWGATDLAMCRPVVLDFDPRLSRLVQEVERQIRHSVEHLHQSALKICPEGLLLAVLVGAKRERLLMKDCKTQQSFRDFIGDHRRAVVG
jgi:hypothetical protein